MIIRLAKSEEARDIAVIHKSEIGGGFLSSLPVSFLANLYQAIIESGGGFCVAAEENGKIVGFIAGTADVKGLYRYFFRNYFFSSTFILAKKVFGLKFIRRVLENIFYPVKEKDLPPAELLTMAVEKDFRGRGIALEMFARFKEEMKQKNVSIFKVLVGEELKPAISFYEKSGFSFLKSASLHGKDISRIYTYDL